MRTLTVFLILACFGVSCRYAHQPVANTVFADSLMMRQDSSVAQKIVGSDLAFWRQRLVATPDSYTALSRYAGLLVMRFHLNGDMADLSCADSILQMLNTSYHGKEAGIFRSLTSLNITRHRFKEAERYALEALTLGGEKYASTLLFFDTQFELGNYLMAGQALKHCVSTNDYGYFFRLSKWKHLQNEADSAAFYMKKAADCAGSNLFLRQAALSNLADLYMHEGKLQEANKLYVGCLSQNPSDHHSLKGIGRIALMKDNNTTEAEKIFRFIASKNQLPDAWYDMVWMEEQRSDTTQQKRYALTFVDKASNGNYGAMYNKYLIDLYTGILHSPAKALDLAEQETRNRATPQTYAWMAWCLHCAGDDARALDIYQQHVSGKPLEALELYWIGKMMKDLGKAYNAREFFKAAELNLYDLSPSKQKDLRNLL